MVCCVKKNNSPGWPARGASTASPPCMSALAAVSTSAAQILQNLAALRARIAAAGSEHVDIVAVTKGQGPEVFDAVRGAGLVDGGESYAQALLARLDQMHGLRIHMIGRCQTNKVRQLAGRVHLWQSVDRAHLADEIARRDPGARVLVQVNVSDEPSKGGCEPDDVDALVERSGAGGLEVRGLMAVGRTGDPELARPGFARLRSMVDRLGLEVCSMGMSDDLEVAVAEGSTMVRVGTALVGARPPHP